VQYPSDEAVRNWYQQHVNSGMFGALAFLGMDTAEVEAFGWTVKTADGREFIDCVGGFGAYNFGHRHPQIVAAIETQLKRMPMSSRLALNPLQAQLAHELAEITPAGLEYSFFSNSGTEAVEAALKLARLHTGKPGIISAQNAFHGKTLGSLSGTHREHFQKPFRPLMEHFRQVEFGNTSALEAALDDTTAAVMLEPVQGEGGINTASEEYFQDVRELCTSRGVLLILDEVQTGMGRTGYNFACERYQISPDILVLAKSLGGGVMPIGATIGTAATWQLWNDAPTVHSSTFGGNQLACSAALAALDVLQTAKLAEKARVNGEFLLGELKALQAEFPQLITAVRGAGLMIGIEMAHPDISQLLIANLVEQGIMAAYTLNKTGVVRLEPPLIMPRDVIAGVLEKIISALNGTAQVVSDFNLLS
jgi:putrescine aminotransferase